MMNKNFFNLLVFLIIATNCFAQDTIFMRNDQRIACKVFEVTPTEVKYKKLELSDGPLYTENKSAIDRIKYKNGFVEIFSETEFPSIKKENAKQYDHTGKKYKDLTTIIGERTIYLYDNRPIGENDLHELLLSLNNTKLTEEIRRAQRSKRFSYTGFLAIPLGVAGIICGANASGVLGFSPYSGRARTQFAGASAIFLSATALSIGTTIYFDRDSQKANKRAIQLYRQMYLNE
jgi:hypothetical protein